MYGVADIGKAFVLLVGACVLVSDIRLLHGYQ